MKAPNPHTVYLTVTGGMSWGDTPTDAYDLVAVIDGLGITEQALSLREVKAAHTATAAA